MTACPNKIVWSRHLGKYIRLVRAESDGEYYYLAKEIVTKAKGSIYEQPITTNSMGYSCHKCQGFIKLGEAHKCYEIRNCTELYAYRHTKWETE